MRGGVILFVTEMEEGFILIRLFLLALPCLTFLSLERVTVAIGKAVLTTLAMLSTDSTMLAGWLTACGLTCN